VEQPKSSFERIPLSVTVQNHACNLNISGKQKVDMEIFVKSFEMWLTFLSLLNVFVELVY